MVNNYQFWEGGGEMGELIRSKNWSETPLGSPEVWPTALKIATSLMLSTPFPMYIAWGKEYTQLYNDGYRPILGSTKHPQAMGISTRETFSEIWHIIESMFDGVMEGKAVGFPNFMLPLERNGYIEECFFDFSYSPIRSEAGDIGGVLVTVIETTDRVRQLAELNKAKLDLERAQAEAIRQRDQLHAFFMQAPAGICVLSGPELIFELVNPPYQQLLPNRHLLGKPIFEALPELLNQPIAKMLRQTYSTGEAFEAHELLVPVVRFERGPLEDRYFNFVYQPRFDEYGAVDGIFAFVYEVTDMVQAKMELEKQKDKSQLAAIAAELGTFDMDLVKGTMDWDKRCRTLFGISHANEVTYEKDFLQGLHPDDRERVIDVINDVFNRSVSGGNYDVEYRTVGVEDQKLRWIRAKGKTYFNDQDKPIRFVGSALDITEQKLNEIRKNDFIAMVSHELKTPLTSLKAYVQTVKNKAVKNGDDLTASLLDKGDRQVKKMSNMIESFLNISRLESGNIPLQKHTFSLSDLLAEKAEEFKLNVQSHTISFEKDLDIFVNADHEKIGQVVDNFITNAIKYSPAGTIIKLSCQQNNNTGIVMVKDEGMGIGKKDLDKLFDRFYRVENNQTKVISGFGIGLYISAEIIKLHDGMIWAESDIGKGSTFYFTLPMA